MLKYGFCFLFLNIWYLGMFRIVWWLMVMRLFVCNEYGFKLCFGNICFMCLFCLPSLTVYELYHVCGIVLLGFYSTMSIANRFMLNNLVWLLILLFKKCKLMKMSMLIVYWTLGSNLLCGFPSSLLPKCMNSCEIPFFVLFHFPCPRDWQALHLDCVVSCSFSPWICLSCFYLLDLVMLLDSVEEYVLLCRYLHVLFM